MHTGNDTQKPQNGDSSKQPTKDYKESDSSSILSSSFESLSTNMPMIGMFDGTEKSLPDEVKKAFKAHLLDRYFGLGTHLYSSSPFFCDLKERYEDFHVLELASGSPTSQVHLTSLTVEDDDDKWAPAKKTLDDLQWENSSAILDGIKLFAEDASKPEVELEIPELNKEQRTSLHQYIRQEHSNCESSTLSKDSKSFLKLCKKRRKDKDGNQVRKDSRWPVGKPDHFRFVLYKENVDTDSAIRGIANNIDQKRFGYCGTKDRRAITTQHVTGYRIRPTEIARNAAVFNRKLNGFGRIEVGHFENYSDKLFLGGHSGNAFRIFLKNVHSFEQGQEGNRKLFVDSLIEKMEKLAGNGFINYFGTQRFGSISMDNHWIGLSILKKDYEGAILGILRPRDPEDRRNRAYNEAMEHYRDTRQAGEAFGKLDGRGKGSLEGKLLQVLAKNDNNYRNALLSGLSRNMRTIYVHAFQSYVWNLMADFRARVSPGKLLLGDLVVKKTKKPEMRPEVCFRRPISQAELESEFPWIPKNIELLDGQEIVTSGAEYSEDGKETADKSSIIFVDEQNIEEYSIDDIYLPMISHDTKSPKNILGAFLTVTLDSFGLDMESYRTMAKEWNMEGSYRKFLGRVKNFSGIPFLYDAQKAPEIVSDLELIRRESGQESTEDNKDEDNSETQNKLIGLMVTFELGIGHYATVALRELVKLGTFSIESRKFDPQESVQNILRHVKICRLFQEYFHEEWPETERKAFEEWVVEKVKGSEKGEDKLANRKFDDFVDFLGESLGVCLKDTVNDSVITTNDDGDHGPSEAKKQKIAE